MNISITLIVVIITGLISYRGFSDRNLTEKFIHEPFREKRNKEWYRMLTSGFLHKDFAHLAVNMFVLYTFGQYVEQAFDSIYGASYGRIVYLLMYLTCIVFAASPSYMKHQNNPSYRALGASGGVSGVLLIFVLLNPLAPLQFIFFPFFDIPAIVVGVGYILYSSYASRKQIGNVGHDAHLYGALYGILFMAVTSPSTIANFGRMIASWM